MPDDAAAALREGMRAVTERVRQSRQDTPARKAAEPLTYSARETAEPLTYDEAVALLPEGEEIHTYRASSFLIGANWPRQKVLDAIRQYGAEVAGPMARAMGHGICVRDDVGPLFIEWTREAS